MEIGASGAMFREGAGLRRPGMSKAGVLTKKALDALIIAQILALGVARHAFPKVTLVDTGELHCCRRLAEKLLREARFGPNSSEIARRGQQFDRFGPEFASIDQTLAKFDLC